MAGDGCRCRVGCASLGTEHGEGVVVCSGGTALRQGNPEVHPCVLCLLAEVLLWPQSTSVGAFAAPFPWDGYCSCKLKVTINVMSIQLPSQVITAADTRFTNQITNPSGCLPYKKLIRNTCPSVEQRKEIL